MFPTAPSAVPEFLHRSLSIVSGTPSRIVFMGTAEFGIRSLDILLTNAYPVVAVVTTPDKPAGRGLHSIPSPVKESAIARGLTLLQPESLKDPGFRDRIASLDPDIIVVVAFRILPEEIFALPKLGTFNLHASLLPKYRGAAPIQRALMNGETESGVTTFLLQKTVDTGGILLQARTPVGQEETAGELYERLSEIGAELVLHTVRLLEQGKALPRQQDDTAATPAPKIFKEQCVIPWNAPAAAVHNHIRALSPVPGAWTMLGRRQLKIYRSRISSIGKEGDPGLILEAGPKFLVSTGNGSVEILEVQQEGRKRLSSTEFLRGCSIAAGERFTVS